MILLVLLFVCRIYIYIYIYIQLALRGSFNTNFFTLRTQFEKPSCSQPMRSSIKFMNYFKTDTYQLLFLDGMILDSEGTSFLCSNVIRSPINTASHPTRSKSSILIYITCEDSGRTSDMKSVYCR